MARYTGPVCRLCRREGMKLFLKGSRCYTKKCAFERRPTPPGQHGVRRRKVGEYGVQLREKQKIRRVYGVLERQFRNYFDDAENRPGVTGENLLRLLETRLDNVVFRMGFALVARPGAPARRPRPLRRQRPADQHRRPTSSSPGDRIEVRETQPRSRAFKIAKETLRSAPGAGVADRRCRKLPGPSCALPRRDQMPLELNEQLVVEYYSR